MKALRTSTMITQLQIQFRSQSKRILFSPNSPKQIGHKPMSKHQAELTPFLQGNEEGAKEQSIEQLRTYEALTNGKIYKKTPSTR